MSSSAIPSAAPTMARPTRSSHAKAEAAWRAGLVAIVCIGETRAEREAGATLDVLSRQIAGSVPAAATPRNTVIAYEPVWAIGTGLTPTADDVAEAHAHIRERAGGAASAPRPARMRILYGGSVKPSNARELLAIANVDGALVGGASLKAADFLGIAEAYRADLSSRRGRSQAFATGHVPICRRGLGNAMKAVY